MQQLLSQKLAGEFRQKIDQGVWAVGERLPTTRELAQTYRVSVHTIQTAFRALESDNLVERRPRAGSFVRSRHRRPGLLRAATTVAAVCPQWAEDIVADEWGHRIINGLSAEIGSSGFHISTFAYKLPDDGSALQRILEAIDKTGDALAGAICFYNEAVAGILPELDRRNIPWVTINRPTRYATHNFVMNDAFRGGRIIGRCFARMGFERVAILSDALGFGRSTGDKFYGFLEGWIECGKASGAVDFIDCKDFHEEIGHDKFIEYLEKSQKTTGVPRAVFASGDFLAQGAIRACRERGLSVPDDVAVIGSTGLKWSAYSHPSLTVLGNPMEQIGADAGQMLLEMAREGVRRMSGRYIKTNLTVRESCPIPAELLASEQAAVDQTS